MSFGNRFLSQSVADQIGLRARTSASQKLAPTRPRSLTRLATASLLNWHHEIGRTSVRSRLKG